MLREFNMNQKLTIVLSVVNVPFVSLINFNSLFLNNKLCVTLNDIEYMRLWLKTLPESLGWEDVINALVVAHGERGGKHARTALENMLSSSDEDMLNKIAAAIEHIGQQVCCDLLMAVFR